MSPALCAGTLLLNYSGTCHRPDLNECNDLGGVGEDIERFASGLSEVALVEHQHPLWFKPQLLLSSNKNAQLVFFQNDFAS